MAARLGVGEGNSAVGVRPAERRQADRRGRCATTSAEGRATVAWYGYQKRPGLIGVGRPKAAPATTFELAVLAAEREEQPPGKPLPSGGTVRDQLDPILDASDAGR